jgi:hypothetical protein
MTGLSTKGMKMKNQYPSSNMFVDNVMVFTYTDSQLQRCYWRNRRPNVKAEDTTWRKVESYVCAENHTYAISGDSWLAYKMRVYV